MCPAYAPGKPQLSRFCKIVRLHSPGFGQKKAKCRRRKQRTTQNPKRNGDAMGPALQYPDNRRAKVPADVAKRIHQADDRAGGRARHRFRGNGKELSSKRITHSFQKAISKNRLSIENIL